MFEPRPNDYFAMEQLTGKRDCKLLLTCKDVEQTEKNAARNANGFDINEVIREAKPEATQRLFLQPICKYPRCI